MDRYHWRTCKRGHLVPEMEGKPVSTQQLATEGPSGRGKKGVDREMKCLKFKGNERRRLARKWSRRFKFDPVFGGKKKRKCWSCCSCREIWVNCSFYLTFYRSQGHSWLIFIFRCSLFSFFSFFLFLFPMIKKNQSYIQKTTCKNNIVQICQRNNGVKDSVNSSCLMIGKLLN